MSPWDFEITKVDFILFCFFLCVCIFFFFFFFFLCVCFFVCLFSVVVVFSSFLFFFLKLNKYILSYEGPAKSFVTGFGLLQWYVLSNIFLLQPSKYSPFTETHFRNLFTQSRKADKWSSFGVWWRH